MTERERWRESEKARIRNGQRERVTEHMDRDDEVQ